MGLEDKVMIGDLDKRIEGLEERMAKLEESIEVLCRSVRLTLGGLKALVGMGKSEECGRVIKEIEKILGELNVKVK